jgi:hypothetical protein
MAANTIVDKVASAGPPGRQGTRGRQPSNSAAPTGSMASRRPPPPGRGTRRREPGRPRPANEPTGSAVAAPAPPARVARRQGPAPAAGRCRCPGRGSAAPTGPGDLSGGQRLEREGRQLGDVVSQVVGEEPLDVVEGGPLPPPGVVDPLPVMATTSPRACSAWAMRSFCSRATRASTDTPLPIKSVRASSPAEIGPIFLHEAEHAVDDHHRDDRPVELRHLADEGQHRGDPEQQREEVNELGGE